MVRSLFDPAWCARSRTGTTTARANTPGETGGRCGVAGLADLRFVAHHWTSPTGVSVARVCAHRSARPGVGSMCARTCVDFIARHGHFARCLPQPQNEHIELHQKRYGKRLDHEERKYVYALPSIVRAQRSASTKLFAAARNVPVACKLQPQPRLAHEGHAPRAPRLGAWVRVVSRLRHRFPCVRRPALCLTVSTGLFQAQEGRTRGS